MKRILFGVAFAIWSAAAWTLEPCCSVVAIDAKTGMVSVEDVRTGARARTRDLATQLRRLYVTTDALGLLQYKAEPVGIKGLEVGDTVDLVSGQLRTAAGAAIAGRVQP